MSHLNLAIARATLKREPSTRHFSYEGETGLLKNSRILLVENSRSGNVNGRLSTLKRIHSNYEFSRTRSSSSSAFPQSDIMSASYHSEDRRPPRGASRPTTSRAISCDDNLHYASSEAPQTKANGQDNNYSNGEGDITRTQFSISDDEAVFQEE